MAMSPEQEQIMYREWGLFYLKRQNLEVAYIYFNKSLTLKPNDPKALYFRSQCQRRKTLTDAALNDAKKALGLSDHNQPFNLEVCDGVYELNQFEEAKCLLSNYSKNFKGKKVEAFGNRDDVLNENFGDTLGDQLGYFILEKEKYFDKVFNEMVRLGSTDPRPIWKMMKDQGKCDDLSVLETQKEVLSAKEVARRKRAFVRFNQIYLGRSWIDVLFLKALTTNKNLLLPQSQLSRPILEELTKQKYDVVLKMLKMLNSRSPLYAEIARSCPNRRRRNNQAEASRFHVQNQTHRNMLQLLKQMHVLRAKEKLEKLQNYVEQVMGDYVVLKTHQEMPWKLLFINEVYNLLALSYCDQFMVIPDNLTDITQRNRLIILLKLKVESEKKPTPYEFGNRATYPDVDRANRNISLHKALDARLTKRLTLAKYPIEKAYLWHEVARSDLKMNQFDKCCSNAAKCIAEATKCNSFVWKLLAMMLMCKSHALLHNIEKVTTVLHEALEIAETLKNDKIREFLYVCIALNKADIIAKKVEAEIRSTKSRTSTKTSSRSGRSK